MAKKQRDFSAGDEVYFMGYKREVEDKQFKANVVLTVIDKVELDGQPAFLVENKKGHQDTVFNNELKIKREAGALTKSIEEAQEKPKKTRMSKKAVGEVLEKQPKPKRQKIEGKDTNIETSSDHEFNQMNALMSDMDGNPLPLILSKELEEEISNSDALTVANSMLDRSLLAQMDLGGVLAHIYQAEVYKQHGYTSFNKFVSEQIPSMEWRKARMLIKFYVVFKGFEVPEETVRELKHWTVCANIAAVATQENIQELIDYAKEHGGNALKEYIRATYGGRKVTERDEEIELIPGEKSKIKSITLSMFEDQYEGVYKPLIGYYADLNPEHKEDPAQLLLIALTDLCQNIGSNNTGGSLTEESFIKTGEGAFPGHDVFIRNRATGEVKSSKYEPGQVSIHAVEQEEQQELELSV